MVLRVEVLFQKLILCRIERESKKEIKRTLLLIQRGWQTVPTIQLPSPFFLYHAVEALNRPKTFPKFLG